jgi:large repetitive protein
VTISIIGPNTGPPVATNDTGNVNFAASVILNLLANDSDPQNNINPASLTITQQPTSGTVAINANGTVTYTHDGVSTATTDSFTYTVSDFTGLTSNTASVVLNISLATI